ncbi:LacI family DNA-binding transcriptional regulator [Phaeobacter sp. B1627]|uniref:LacI family DNA-binding transcriptional regulator n=1 Tax=Phaeobacter sp. B1627 TaxID=2583809 RepID=UPI00111B90ED|nr:LacI family DNA-binding transcriptional regulator [Phaeobacter sp. B1627]TNJ43328.1 LacI family transcriptional regulator [Phaeobacter sp. B1627]
MSEKPTLSTVARAAGVSVPTVSQVLRGTGRISEKTRQKVLETARRLQYVPDYRAAAMRSGENREIGFIINQLSNPFNAEVVSGALDLLEDEGYLVSILDARDDADRQGRHVQAFISHGRGGLLWVPAVDTPDETYDLLASRSIPTVTFLRQGRADFDHLGVRNAQATEQATDHLADLGHHRIAYFGGTMNTTVRQDRIAGYSRAMLRRGLEDPLIWPCGDGKVAGLEAMQDLLSQHPDVTAIVCNGDMVALGACLALIRSGRTPGREVSVIGFDGIQDAAVATPPLTTLAVEPQMLGRELARMLLHRIEAPDKPVTISEARVELRLGETTGPAPPRIPAAGAGP